MKNRTHLAVTADEQAFWAFVVPATAATCTEETREMTALCSDLFEAFGDYVRPRRIEFQLSLLSEDRPLPERGEDVEAVETLEQEVVDESGIDVDDFVAATTVSHDGGTWLPVVDVSRCQVAVALEEAERYVDRSTGSRLYRGAEPSGQAPPHDPLELSVSQVPNVDQSDVEAAFLYYVYVRLYTDVIYEDSDVGAANRRKLSSFLGRVDDCLSAAKIRREPAIDGLDEIY